MNAMANEPVMVENRDEAPGDGGPAKSKGLRVMISFGLAILDRDISLKQIMARADEALYRTKEGGRNRVCLWSPSEGGEESGDDAGNEDDNDGG